MALNLYEIVRNIGPRQSPESPHHLVKKRIGPPSAPEELCVDALSGQINLWQWIDPAPSVDLNQARSSPSPSEATASSVDTPTCEDNDIHGCDALAAAVDFDAWGNGSGAT
jgi:hypothetical protein